MAAALGGIVGYFDLVPGAHELMTRWSRATGLFKDPNVFGPFLVPALVYALSRLAGAPLRKSAAAARRAAGRRLCDPAQLLARRVVQPGAWPSAIYGALHVLTARSNRVRLRFIALAVGAGMAAAGVVVVALQFDAVADLLSERAALTQSYDEGPEGRFGGQEKAARLIVEQSARASARSSSCRTTTTRSRTTSTWRCSSMPAGSAASCSSGSSARPPCWACATPSCAAPTQPLFLVVYACFVGNASRASSSTSTTGATSTC